MSEVKRYTESCMEGGGVVESKDGELVDFSAWQSAQSELSALREELAKVSGERDRLRNGVGADMAEIDRIQSVYDAKFVQCRKLRASLTAAEQRNSELVELLRDAAYAVKGHAMTAWAVPLYIRISKALTKPTESRASE